MGITQINNTLNQLQNDTNRIQYQNGQKNLGKSELGKDAFLNLLLTQLKYQDPINPVDNKEFIAQQAQFTQIEKLDNINATLQNANNITQASSLVGKRVDIKKPDGSMISGRIDSIQIGTKGLGIKINGQTDTYTQDQISQVYSN
ncbi:MAG: flagellar hook assembly protein FlgD [Cyanobacteria bacterium]|nr:flagellar hook assembly protein FlgD [Cyanobacteriota bacterium]